MKILITGSSGRIGSAIAQHLSPEHELRGLDLQPGPFTTQIGDLSEMETLKAQCQGLDAVIHTAALHAPHVGQIEPRMFWQTNVEATQRLIDTCVDQGVRRLVYTSTTSLYGDAMVNPDRAVWVDEDLAPQPRDIYDETKLAAEQLCAQATEQSSLTCVALRMSRCFPEPAQLMTIYRLYRGVDSRDVAKAHELALQVELERFEVCNVSAQSPFSPSELVQLQSNARQVIESHYPWAAQIFAARGWSLPQSIDRVYVVERARQLLGYQPNYNFDSLFEIAGDR